MTVYLAPLEGVTDAVFRRVHRDCFSGVAKYFIPFVSPTQNLAFTSRDLAAIAPENNAGVPAVPQLLAKDASLFLWAAQALGDMGYSEVNLNLGCPSGPVTAKGKGSGLLADYPALERFLDGIFECAPLPISIKTRIGYASADEFERLLALFSRYPVRELIVHPRTRGEFYKGTPHRDVFARAFSETALPLCYNGDLFTPADVAAAPALPLMLGRGLQRDPSLLRRLWGGERATAAELQAYHDALCAAYRRDYSGDTPVLHRMRELWTYLSGSFRDTDAFLRAVRKARTLSAYDQAARAFFAQARLSEE